MIARVLPICFLVIVALSLSGCELFIIGNSKRIVVPDERSQRTSAAVAHLFKAEIDTGNTVAATELMVTATGTPLLALHKYELGDDLARWRTIMAGKPVTSTVVDTISQRQHNVSLTVDYTRVVHFSALLHDSKWWITSIHDEQKK